MTARTDRLNAALPGRLSLRHLAVVAVIVGLLVPQVAGRFYTFLAASIIVAGLYAAAYDVLYGYTGLLSFGHAVFFGTGAYIATFAINDYGAGILAAALAGFVVSAVLAVGVGLVAVRLATHGFVIVTILIVLIANLVVNTLSVTGGSDGIAVDLFEMQLPLLGELSFTDPAVGYYLVFGVFVVSVLVMYLLVNSSVGLVFKMIRENETRARMLGYNTTLYKLAAFMVSGAFTGLAGALDMAVTRFVSAADFTITVSADPLVHVIIGGRATLFGGVIGAAIVRGLSDQFSELTDIYPLFIGLVLIVMVLYEPEGILGLARSFLESRAGEGGEPAGTEADASADGGPEVRDE